MEKYSKIKHLEWPTIKHCSGGQMPKTVIKLLMP